MTASHTYKKHVRGFPVHHTNHTIPIMGFLQSALIGLVGYVDFHRYQNMISQGPCYRAACCCD